MKTRTVPIVLGLIFVFGNGSGAIAQVRRVQMHIAGYLCGN